VPLRLRGLTRSIALEYTEQCWSSWDYQLCGFVPIHGTGTHAEARLELAPGGRLHLDDRQEQLDADGIRAALAHPVAQHWTGLTVAGNEPFDELYLWLATQLDGFARLYADQDAIEAGLVDRWTRYGAATLAAGDSLAYLAPLQPTGDGARHEFGVRAHGPHGPQLAATMTAYAQQWHYHRDHSANITVSPADPTQPQTQPGGRIVHKRHTSVLITWPPASPQPAP
jgi:protein-L-isoaspartate(D-aspartate) O-methyltransferase